MRRTEKPYKGLVYLIGFINVLLFWGKASFSQAAPGANFNPRSILELTDTWEFKRKGAARWEKIRIPSNIDEEGVFFFRKSFRIPSANQGAQFILNLEGINFSYRVKWNDQYLAIQNHGFTPLAIPIPSDQIRFQGTNLLEVEVQTSLSGNDLPLRSALLQPTYPRGIFRKVYLQILPPIAFATITHHTSITKDGTRAEIVCHLQLSSTPAGYQLTTSLNPAGRGIWVRYRLFRDRFLQQVVFGKNVRLDPEILQNGSIDIPFILQKPRLWSPETPNLYFAEILVEVDGKVMDRVLQPVGLRRFQLQGNRVLLNQKEVILRGATLIEDRYHLLTTSNSAKEFQEILNLGLNCISWFTPPEPQLLSQLDSLGIMTILRIPVWNTPSAILARREFQDKSGKILTRLLTLAENHPSVLALSLGEGYDSEDPETYRFIKRLRSKTGSAMDYFITAGFRNFRRLHSNLPLDFVTLDLTGWYPGDLSAWVDRWMVENGDLPVLFSDVAVPFVPVQSDSENLSLYESIQAFQLKRAIQNILEHPTLGFILGPLYDWQGTYPSLLVPTRTRERIFPLGIADPHHTPRMAWSMIQNINSSQEDQFSFQNSETGGSDDNLFLFFGLTLIALFLYNFRRDHRLRGNFVRILTRPFGFHLELREGRKISMSTSGVIFATQILCLALIFAALFFYLRQHLLFDFFLSQVAPNYLTHFALIQMAWQPAIGIPGFGILFGLAIILLAGYIRTLALFTRVHLSFRNALTWISWEGTIFVFLLPIALVFHRLLAIRPLHFPLLLLLACFALWYIYRLFVGMKTIFAFPRWLSFLLIVVFPMITLGIVLLIYDQNREIVAQTKYLVHIWKSGF